MLTAGDALAKSQKVTFWSKKNGFGCFFFLLTAEDALMGQNQLVLNHISLLAFSTNLCQILTLTCHLECHIGGRGEYDKNNYW